MDRASAVIRRSSEMSPQQTRRRGMMERRLLTPDDSRFQNLVLFDMEVGAEVEYHEVSNSESLFILEGVFEVVLDGTTKAISVGDACYFPQESSHGLRCIEGPGRFLAIFAPARQTGGR
jgi:quercetin dioxygenase-like cupin family protein